MAYEINDEYEVPKSKILDINDDTQKQTQVDFGDNKLPTSVAEDRSGHVDSLIIKLMKNKKVIFYKALINQVMSMLLFPQEREQVQARVKELVKRGYLEEVKKEDLQPTLEQMEVDEEAVKPDDPDEELVIKYVL